MCRWLSRLVSTRTRQRRSSTRAQRTTACRGPALRPQPGRPPTLPVPAHRTLGAAIGDPPSRGDPRARRAGPEPEERIALVGHLRDTRLAPTPPCKKHSHRESLTRHSGHQDVEHDHIRSQNRRQARAVAHRPAPCRRSRCWRQATLALIASRDAGSSSTSSTRMAQTVSPAPPHTYLTNVVDSCRVVRDRGASLESCCYGGKGRGAVVSEQRRGLPCPRRSLGQCEVWTSFTCKPAFTGSL
jgi:hypothetical protein